MHVRPSFMALAAFGLLSLSYFLWKAPASSPSWIEIEWPFPRDAWPNGRAFRCVSGPCGRGAELYVRPKLGFCNNCEIGVADDEEVDRVTDVVFIGENFVAMAPGRSVSAAGMVGRLRHYGVVLRGDRTRAVTALALARNCDIVVALILVPASQTAEQEQAAVAWLSSPKVTAWLQSALAKS